MSDTEEQPAEVEEVEEEEVEMSVLDALKEVRLGLRSLVLRAE